MKNFDILRQLFIRETTTDMFQPGNEVAQFGPRPESFEGWKSSKRALNAQEISGTHWIKTCSGGYITEVEFHSDGTLNEHRLFDRFPTVGTWTLEDGILHVTIIKAENTYQFSVVGNANVNIHSAIEYKNSNLHSYLKLAQIK